VRQTYFVTRKKQFYWII